MARQPDLFRQASKPPAATPCAAGSWEPFDDWDLARMEPQPGWTPPEEVQISGLDDE